MCSYGSIIEKLQKMASWKTTLLFWRLLASGHVTWKYKTAKRKEKAVQDISTTGAPINSFINKPLDFDF